MRDHAAPALGHAVDLAQFHIVAVLQGQVPQQHAGQQGPLSAYADDQNIDVHLSRLLRSTVDGVEGADSLAESAADAGVFLDDGSAAADLDGRTADLHALAAVLAAVGDHIGDHRLLHDHRTGPSGDDHRQLVPGGPR